MSLKFVENLSKGDSPAIDELAKGDSPAIDDLANSMQVDDDDFWDICVSSHESLEESLEETLYQQKLDAICDQHQLVEHWVNLHMNSGDISTPNLENNFPEDLIHTEHLAPHRSPDKLLKEALNDSSDDEIEVVQVLPPPPPFQYGLRNRDKFTAAASPSKAKVFGKAPARCTTAGRRTRKSTAAKQTVSLNPVALRLRQRSPKRDDEVQMIETSPTALFPSRRFYGTQQEQKQRKRISDPLPTTSKGLFGSQQQFRKTSESPSSSTASIELISDDSPPETKKPKISYFAEIKDQPIELSESRGNSPQKLANLSEVLRTTDLEEKKKSLEIIDSIKKHRLSTIQKFHSKVKLKKTLPCPVEQKEPALDMYNFKEIQRQKDAKIEQAKQMAKADTIRPRLSNPIGEFAFSFDRVKRTDPRAEQQKSKPSNTQRRTGDSPKDPYEFESSEEEDGEIKPRRWESNSPNETFNSHREGIYKVPKTGTEMEQSPPRKKTGYFTQRNFEANKKPEINFDEEY